MFSSFNFFKIIPSVPKNASSLLLSMYNNSFLNGSEIFENLTQAFSDMRNVILQEVGNTTLSSDQNGLNATKTYDDTTAETTAALVGMATLFTIATAMICICSRHFRTADDNHKKIGEIGFFSGVIGTLAGAGTGALTYYSLKP